MGPIVPARCVKHGTNLTLTKGPLVPSSELRTCVSRKQISVPIYLVYTPANVDLPRPPSINDGPVNHGHVQLSPGIPAPTLPPITRCWRPRDDLQPSLPALYPRAYPKLVEYFGNMGLSR